MPSKKSKAPRPAGITKRRRTDNDHTNAASVDAEAMTSPLTEGLLSEESMKGLKSEYQLSSPYPHGVIKGLCQPDRLRAIREEIVTNVKATFKESDIFKVYQTPDLANLDGSDPELAAALPNLFALRNAIYSPEFRAFVGEVTGAGELTDKIDCSCNVYTVGGHLLCHDDVIGTRAVSYIIYLADEDEEEWTAQDGGALELFPLQDGILGEPAFNPTATLLPHFNSMAMFTVLPGRSFHSVQEVFAEHKPRISISGWYHRDTPPEGFEHASLNQLQSRKGEDDKGAFDALPTTEAEEKHVEASEKQDEDEEENYALAADEIEYLSNYINPAYLKADMMKKMNEQFCEDSSVQLREFLLAQIAQPLTQLLAASDAEDNVGMGKVPAYEAGMDRLGWVPAGAPHKQHFLRYEGAAQKGAMGGELKSLQDDLFKSAAFVHWLEKVTSLTPKGVRSAIRRFRPGLDYTVAHFGIITQQARLDATLCFVDDAEGSQADNWASGDVGGFECYIGEDDESVTGAAEVFRMNDDGEDLLSVTAALNTLSLVLRDEGTMRFIKYVSAGAPSSRYDIALEYDVDLDPTSDDEEDEQEDEDGESEQLAGEVAGEN